jgi:hypothetical protein
MGSTLKVHVAEKRTLIEKIKVDLKMRRGSDDARTKYSYLNAWRPSAVVRTLLRKPSPWAVSMPAPTMRTGKGPLFGSDP